MTETRMGDEEFEERFNLDDGAGCLWALKIEARRARREEKKLQADNIELVTRGVEALERSVQRGTDIKKLEKENEKLLGLLQMIGK